MYWENICRYCELEDVGFVKENRQCSQQGRGHNRGVRSAKSDSSDWPAYLTITMSVALTNVTVVELMVVGRNRRCSVMKGLLLIWVVLHSTDSHWG